jgi:hypothetical protein
VRGPLAASKTLERLAAAAADAAADKAGAAADKPEILVLTGGFEGWSEAAAKDPELALLTVTSETAAAATEKLSSESA